MTQGHGHERTSASAVLTDIKQARLVRRDDQTLQEVRTVGENGSSVGVECRIAVDTAHAVAAPAYVGLGDKWVGQLGGPTSRAGVLPGCDTAPRGYLGRESGADLRKASRF